MRCNALNVAAAKSKKTKTTLKKKGGKKATTTHTQTNRLLFLRKWICNIAQIEIWNSSRKAHFFTKDCLVCCGTLCVQQIYIYFSFSFSFKLVVIADAFVIIIIVTTLTNVFFLSNKTKEENLKQIYTHKWRERENSIHLTDKLVHYFEFEQPNAKNGLMAINTMAKWNWMRKRISHRTNMHCHIAVYVHLRRKVNKV